MFATFTHKQAFPEEFYPEIIKMFSSNVSRVISPPEDPNAADYDPEEDEPIQEPSFVHLEIVYAVFQAFIESSEFQTHTAKKYLHLPFFDQLCEVLDSTDPRERESVKGILHRLYSKFGHVRPHIRRIFTHTLLRFIYEKEQYNGVAEILEILASIINGFAQPVKADNIAMLQHVLLPLFKCKSIGVFHAQLTACVVHFLEKAGDRIEIVIQALLKYWPVHSSPKEVCLSTDFTP